jgi:hypothetical protein
MTAPRRRLRPADGMDIEERRRVEDAAEKWSKAVLACRVNGHSWSGYYSVGHRPGLYTVVQRCTRRCGLWREGDMNDYGYMVSAWRPHYPEGDRYLMPKGQGRVTTDGKAALRLRLILDAEPVEVTDE